MASFHSAYIPKPKNLVLSRDDVNVWYVSLKRPSKQVEHLAQTLSADEQSRAERYYFDRDKERFIVGRGMLRKILSFYLEIEPSRVQFCYGAYGKPDLSLQYIDEKLYFNMSHSHDVALIGIAHERELGIDIEYIRPIAQAQRIAKKIFSAYQNNILCSLPNIEQNVNFLRCWTRKEAYIKACGSGFACSLKTLDFSFAVDEESNLLHHMADSQESHQWLLKDVSAPTGYVGAIAVEGYGWNLTYLEAD